MPRPPKRRRVEFVPSITYFKPAGIPLRQLEEVCLTIDEVEALRLKDVEGLDQEDAAERMSVAQSTFQRILVNARSKVAQAIVEGKAIRIEGGHYYLTADWLKCPRCHHRWSYSGGRLGPGGVLLCPRCGGEAGSADDE